MVDELFNFLIPIDKHIKFHSMASVKGNTKLYLLGQLERERTFNQIYGRSE